MSPYTYTINPGSGLPGTGCTEYGTSEKEGNLTKRKTGASPVVFLLLLSLLLSAGCSRRPAGAAEGESAFGAAFFRDYYTREAASDGGGDYTHMRLEGVEPLVSSTVGTAVETEELRMEVMGALFGGNTAEIVLRVTAKNLDSVLNDEPQNYLSHYQFADASAMLGMMLPGGNALVSFGYTYPDTEESLAPNQFLLHYWILTREKIAMETFALPLQGFGRIGSTGRVENLYEGNWQVEIAVDPAADSSKELPLSEEITVEGEPFTVEKLSLTPLGCTVQLRYAGEAPTTEDAGGLFQTLAGAREQFAVTFTDGTSLRPDPDRIAVGSNEDMQQPDGGSPWDEYRLSCPFDAPVAVEEIAAVTLCGVNLSCR